MGKINLEIITYISAIAIIFLLWFHIMGTFRSNDAVLSTWDQQLYPLIRIVGLALFTFISGFKLFINHSDELIKKELSFSYIKKRVLRLGKAYIGFTILGFAFLVLIYSTRNHHMKYIQDIFTIENLKEFLMGDNPVINPLWYVYVLLFITLFFLIVLYYTNFRVLFGFLLIFLMTWIIFSNIQIFFPLALIFGFGMLYANFYLKKDRVWTVIFKILSVSFIVIMIFLYAFTQNMNLFNIDFSVFKPTYDFILRYSWITLGITGVCFFTDLILFIDGTFFKKITLVQKLLLVIGTYSFAIYLFHWLVLLTFKQFFLKIPYSSLYALVLIFLVIIASICWYLAVKYVKLNKLFE
jgi:peptidoglycan/LPS O-acetylase OafA/YrhL